MNKKENKTGREANLLLRSFLRWVSRWEGGWLHKQGSCRSRDSPPSTHVSPVWGTGTQAEKSKEWIWWMRQSDRREDRWIFYLRPECSGWWGLNSEADNVLRCWDNRRKKASMSLLSKPYFPSRIWGIKHFSLPFMSESRCFGVRCRGCLCLGLS